MQTPCAPWIGGTARRTPYCLGLLVVVEPEMGNLILTLQIPQGIFQLGELNEQIVLRVQERGAHRALEVER